LTVARSFAGGDPGRVLRPDEASMSLGALLVVILILALVGAIPNWGYSRSWGYGPSGVVGVVLVVVIVLLLMGRI
jgi:hypothetical protein